MTDQSIPGFLCHYYEASQGPFLNLSDLPLDEAERLLSQIRAAGDVFASQRAADYMEIRRELEKRVRNLFVAKGGKPQRERPHYMILGACSWVRSWYRDGRELSVPLANFDSSIVSFTYGDTFPAMRCRDGMLHRGQVYMLGELDGLIQAFGLPQVRNPDGRRGPDRYIEAQVWADDPLAAYLKHGHGDRQSPGMVVDQSAG